MKVSVIMRTYNRAYCIGEALDSVLRQTYRNFEVVVVDDGSTDNTQEIVSSFQNDNIRYIRHDHNRGVSVAGNTGIKAATGDAIAHLDSDDLWKPEMLNSLVNFFNRHPEVGAVFCGVQLIRNGEPPSSIASLMEAFPKLLALHTQLKSDDIVFSNREMYLCLLEEVPIKPSAALIRRSVVDHIGGYNESMVSGEDWELYLRILKILSVWIYKSPTYNYANIGQLDAFEIPRTGQDLVASTGHYRKRNSSRGQRSYSSGESRNLSPL